MMKSFKKIVALGLALASCSINPIYAQVNNPNQPAAVNAGVGLYASGASLNVTYGTTANTSLQGNALAAPTPIGNTTPNTGAFTSLSATGAVTGTGFSGLFAAPYSIGNTTPNTGAFTSLSATGAVTGQGFANYLASPPAIGATTPNSGVFSSLNNSVYTANVTGAGGRNLYSKLNDFISALDFSGVDPTGSAASDTGLTAWLNACAGKICVLPSGTYKVTTGNLPIASNTTLQFLGNATINYTGTASAFTIYSAKDVTITNPVVSLSGAGAIGFDIQGAWFLNIYSPVISGNSTSNGQKGISILSSTASNLGFGAYMINIFNPDFTKGAAQYGIFANLQTSDTVRVTHLNVYSGWSSGYPTPIYLRNVSTFRIEGFTPEQGVDGINIGSNSSNGFISLGEMSSNTGYGINFVDATVANMNVILPSAAGNGGSLGLINTTYYTPNQYLSNKFHLLGSTSGSVNNYSYDLVSAYNYTTSMTETVQGGGSLKTLRNYGEGQGGGQQINWVQGISGSASAANNLRGTASATGTTASFSVTFTTAEPTNTYKLAVTPGVVNSGTPAAGANRILNITKLTTGFTVTLEAAPGAGNSQQFDWLLIE